MPLKTKREREEPCHICQHYHDVRSACNAMYLSQ